MVGCWLGEWGMGEEIVKKGPPRVWNLVDASALFPSQPRLGAPRGHLTALKDFSWGLGHVQSER